MPYFAHVLFGALSFLKLSACLPEAVIHGMNVVDKDLECLKLMRMATRNSNPFEIEVVYTVSFFEIDGIYPRSSMTLEKFQTARVSTLRCLLGIPHRLPHQPPRKVHPRRSRNAKRMSRWRLQNDGSAFLLRVCRDIWGYMEIYGDIWGYIGIYGDMWRWFRVYSLGQKDLYIYIHIYIYMYLTSINHVIDLGIPVTSLLARCP